MNRQKLPDPPTRPDSGIRLLRFKISQEASAKARIIDFVWGPEVLIHIEHRADSNKVIINDYIAGVWRDAHEVELLSQATPGCEIQVSIQEYSATISLWDGQKITFDSDMYLAQFDRVSLTPNLNALLTLEEHATTVAHIEQNTANGSIVATSPSKVAAKDQTAVLKSSGQLKTRGYEKAEFSKVKVKLDPAIVQRSNGVVKAAESGTLPETAPEYVRTMFEEYKSVQMEVLKKSSRPLPDRWSPIVVSVVKNEIDRLHDFLRHYRCAGIERFCFIDNGSTDDTIAFLRAQPDTDVLQKIGPFEWKIKQGWINRAMERYGTNRWFMYLDADEHIVFDGLGRRTFRDLAIEMEKRGVQRVRGFLIDMYADCPLLNSTYETHSKLSDAYPYFDRNSYAEERYKEIISVKGGPRTRVFGDGEKKFRPELTKYPLFQRMPGEYMANPHHLWPYDGNFVSERYLGILHYKFLPGVISRIKGAVEAKNYWDGSFEYQCYLDRIEKDPMVSLMSSSSSRFTEPSDLVEAGLLAEIHWSTSRDSPEAIYQAAFHSKKSEIDSYAGFSAYMGNLISNGSGKPSA